MTRKRKYAEPTQIIFRTDIRFVARMDQVALRQDITRTALFEKAMKQYLAKVN